MRLRLFRQKICLRRVVLLTLVPTWTFALSLSCFQKYERLGYVGLTPALPQTIQQFDQIVAVTFFEEGFKVAASQEEYVPGIPFFWPKWRETFRLGETNYRGRSLCNKNYCHASRVLQSLFDAGQLDEAKPKLSQESVSALLNIAERFRLRPASRALHQSDLTNMTGVIVTARAGKAEYQFIAANHGLSLGYSSYFELLLVQEGQKLTLSHLNHFAYGRYELRPDEILMKALLEWLILVTVLYVFWVGVIAFRKAIMAS